MNILASLGKEREAQAIPVDWGAGYAEQLHRVYNFLRYRVGDGALVTGLCQCAANVGASVDGAPLSMRTRVFQVRQRLLACARRCCSRVSLTSDFPPRPLRISAAAASLLTVARCLHPR